MGRGHLFAETAAILETFQSSQTILFIRLIGTYSNTAFIVGQASNGRHSILSAFPRLRILVRTGRPDGDGVVLGQLHVS